MIKTGKILFPGWGCQDSYLGFNSGRELPGAKEGALRIIRNVLKGEILSLEQVASKYLKPK
jgi:hypothetical protein